MSCFEFTNNLVGRNVKKGTIILIESKLYPPKKYLSFVKKYKNFQRLVMETKLLKYSVKER
jgi:hypothetical protein